MVPETVTRTEVLCGHRKLLRLITAWIIFVRLSGAAAEHGHSRANLLEPTVTGEEARLLNAAMIVASTNASAAIRMLQAEITDRASPALDFAVGNLCFQQEHLDAAARAYRAALMKLPKFRRAVMNLGRIHLLQGETGPAIELYQALVTDGRADADIFLLLGHALLMEDCPVSAETAYRQALLLRPRDRGAMLGMTKCLLRQERYVEAQALLRELMRMDPDNRELWSLQSNAFLAVGKTDAAARALENARRLGCADAEMLAALGDLYLDRDQPEDALDAYSVAFGVEAPSVPRMLRAVQGFLMLHDHTRAGEMVDRINGVLQRNPDAMTDSEGVKLLRLRGEVAQQRGNMKQAMSFYEKLLRRDPLDGRTMLLVADLQRDLGRLEDAVMTCERAARVPGSEADALVRQGRIEVERGCYGRAVQLLEAAQAFRDQPHVKRYLEQVRRLAE